MIDYKESDERYYIGENKEYILNTDIKVLKLIKLISKIYIDNVDKESDEKMWIDISYDKDYDERCQIGENGEDRLTDDIEVLKLVKLSSKKNIDNIGKEYDEINWKYMSDDKDADE